MRSLFTRILPQEQSFSPGSENLQIRRSNGSLYLSFLLVALVLSAYFFIPGVGNWINHAVEILASNDNERIETWIGQFGWFGPVLLVLAMVGQMFLLVVPTTLLLVVCILAYGPAWGSVLALFSIYAASSVGYFLGRGLGALTVENMLGSKTRKKSTDFVEKYGFWAIFITRLNPFLSNDVVSLVSGIIKIGYWKFISASLAGIAPLIALIAIMREDFQNLVVVLLASSAIVLLLFCAHIFMDKKRKPILQTK